MASWFRFVVLSRPVLLQGLQVNTVCGVCWVGRGEEKERKEEQDGVGEEREREREGRGGGTTCSSSFKTSLSPTFPVGQTRP